MATHADLLSQAQKIAARYSQGREIRSSDNEWQSSCPLHADNTPSFHITVTDKLLFRCHAGCDQKDIILKLKQDGLWMSAKVDKDPNAKPIKKINLPPHKEPDWDQVHISNKRPSDVYTYTDDKGVPQFWVLRIDTPQGKKIRPYSSVADEAGHNSFELSLQLEDRPLYNLYSLVKRPDDPVLVVEGEKTCDAAQDAFPDYVCVTWSGGTGGIRKSDFGPLANRNVILCPDNDEPGIEAMVYIATKLKSINDEVQPLITINQVDKLAPKGWDFADDCEADIYSPELYVANATPFDYESRKLDEVSEDSDVYVKEFNKKYMAVNVDGQIMYFNLSKQITDSIYPYVYLKNETALRAVERHQVYDMRVEKYVKTIDYWLRDPSRPTMHGVVFDITTKDKIVNGYLNTFLGLDTEPKALNDRYKIFIEHVEAVMSEMESTFFLDWLAHMIQYPEYKPGIMVILTGLPGTGKSILGEIIASMLGSQSAVSVETSAFTDSSFNSLFSRKLFVVINEFEASTRQDKKFLSKLKSWVTDSTYMINAKGAQQRTERSYHRYMATTNSNFPLPIDINDRRYALMEVRNPFHRNETSYFKPLWDLLNDHDALCSLHHYLKNREIVSDFNKPPQTEARQEAQSPEDYIEGFVYKIAMSGIMPSEIAEQLFDTDVKMWTDEGIVIPRPFIKEYFEKSKVYYTSQKINAILRKYIPLERSIHPENQMRMMVPVPRDRNSTKEIKTQMWEFPPLEELRKRWDEVNDTKTKWEPITNEMKDGKSEKVVTLFPRDAETLADGNNPNDDVF